VNPSVCSAACSWGEVYHKPPAQTLASRHCAAHSLIRAHATPLESALDLDISRDQQPGLAPPPILQTRGLVKRFGRVVALDHADFDLMPHEILGVIGDNGAGKSTLIKVIAGAVIPDAGQVLMDGKPIYFKNPMDARAAGIETVYQNLALSPALSIAENMFLGRERRRPGLLGQFFRMLDRAEMLREARQHLNALGLLTIRSIRQPVETLSGGQRQGVAVVRATVFGSRVMIMDEPTAALGVKEGARTDARREEARPADHPD
jgi:fructose transport system ATP-binding protein